MNTMIDDCNSNARKDWRWTHIHFGWLLKFLILGTIVSGTFDSLAQVRNGWRSVFDTQGRLTRMNYYIEGEIVPDSNHFFQYHSDQILKGLVKGELNPQSGSRTGSVFLFNEEGNLTNFNISNNGQIVLNVTCDEYGSCTSAWSDPFDSPTDLWVGDSMLVQNGELKLFSKYNLAAAIYNPPGTIDIKRPFNMQILIPKQGNSAKQGVVLGWKDPENYYLFEISYGKFFSALYYENGILNKLTEPRQPITSEADEFIVLKISNNGRVLIFDVNGNIEFIMPIPKFKGSQLGLVSRARGTARFADMKINYPMDPSDGFYSDKWIGKGTGFFIAPNKILTTYENIALANALRVKGTIDGKPFMLNAKLVQVEERSNLAVLQLERNILTEKELNIIGISEQVPTDTTQFLCIGYPHSLSGILDIPNYFEGKKVPSSPSHPRSLAIEMPFRFGMLGAPVFDNNLNLMGIASHKSYDINYSEIIDFHSNAMLFRGFSPQFSNNKTSSILDNNKNDQIQKLSNLVVIIESYIFESETATN